MGRHLCSGKIVIYEGSKLTQMQGDLEVSLDDVEGNSDDGPKARCLTNSIDDLEERHDSADEIASRNDLRIFDDKR